MSVSRIILVILDGGADRPQAVLGGMTPFEAASTPTFDAFARTGSQGLMSFLPYVERAPDLPGPTSDQAHLMLLGQSSKYSNRGEFMAWGIGLEPTPGELCCRAYAKARVGHTIVSFSPTLSREEATAIEKACTGRVSARECSADVTLSFDPFAYCPRWGSLLFSADRTLGQHLTMPEHLPKLEYFSDNEAVFSAICEGRAHEAPLPSNRVAILNQIGATMPTDNASQLAATLVRQFVDDSIERFSAFPTLVSKFRMPLGMIQPTEAAAALGRQVRFGLRWQRRLSAAAFSEKIEVHGVMRALGFDRTVHHGNILTAVDEVLQAIGQYDFVFLQFKRTDSMSHDNDPHGKVAVVESVDAFVRTIHTSFPESVFVLTADHTTPCGLYHRIHTREPVPFVICGPCITPDGTSRFGERYAADGAFGLIEASSLLSILGEQVENPIATDPSAVA